MRRAQINLVDIALTFFVVVAIVVLAPYFYKFIGMVSAEADPFSALLLELIVPLLIISLIISVGVSARRRIRR
jgi:hypothetical protein